MKHVTGLANDSGTRIASTALSRVQDRMSGVLWREQIRIKAVSIYESFAVRLQVPEGLSKECAIAHLRLAFFTCGLKIGKETGKSMSRQRLGSLRGPCRGRRTTAGPSRPPSEAPT